jgi:hypothetical protein
MAGVMRYAREKAEEEEDARAEKERARKGGQ